jgi:putative ABC transport system ATP-binding protein
MQKQDQIEAARMRLPREPGDFVSKPLVTTPPIADMPPIVDMRDVGLTLTSRAGAVEILRGVSLAIPSGQSVAIVGPSGSGKTSLMMIMAGLEQATRGRIIVGGHDFSALDEDGLARVRGADIGIVFQSFHLVPTMTALENVALPLEFANNPNAFDIAATMLAEVGLAKRAEHFPAQLSGGEQQRVAIARALAPKPKLILADEPTGNLDGNTGNQVIDLLFGLHRRANATLVLITHDTKLAGLCSRTVSMADGRIVENAATPARERSTV